MLSGVTNTTACARPKASHSLKVKSDRKETESTSNKAQLANLIAIAVWNNVPGGECQTSMLRKPPEAFSHVHQETSEQNSGFARWSAQRQRCRKWDAERRPWNDWQREKQGALIFQKNPYFVFQEVHRCHRLSLFHLEHVRHTRLSHDRMECCNNKSYWVSGPLLDPLRCRISRCFFFFLPFSFEAWPRDANEWTQPGRRGLEGTFLRQHTIPGWSRGGSEWKVPIKLSHLETVLQSPHDAWVSAITHGASASAVFTSTGPYGSAWLTGRSAGQTPPALDPSGGRRPGGGREAGLA